MNTNIEYDVIVAGAGSAGAAAAIQAARAGAKTLLIEKNSTPGGTITSGGVSMPGIFHAWGKQVIAGIGWELVEKTVKESGGKFPDFTKYEQPHWCLQTKINPFLYSCILEEAFINSGVDLIYHAMPIKVQENKDRINISIVSKDGTFEYSAKILIDASGDADFIRMAGFELINSSEKQPATPIIRLGGYSLDLINIKEIETAFREEIQAGRMDILDTGHSRSMRSFLNLYGENSIHLNADMLSSGIERSRLEQRGRTVILRLYRFLKRFKGMENLRIDYIASECGVRETFRINGEVTISAEDYIKGRVWPDSLSYAFYPIDLHQSGASSGLDCRKLEYGVIPTIPRGALIPKGTHRLIAAGRCVSSERLANSGLRVQASCMGMGQSAGAMAALSALRNIAPMQLPIEDVKALLQKHGAIVPK